MNHMVYKEENLFVVAESSVHDTHRWVILSKRLHFYVDRYAHEDKVKKKIDAAHFFV